MAIIIPDAPPCVVVPAGTVLWRVHPAAMGAVWFGPDQRRPARFRFDAADHEFGVCYFGDSLAVAFLETLVRGAGRVVAHTDALQRSASALPVRRDLRVLQFEGAGLPRLGIDAGRTHAEPYAECQALSRDVHHRHPEIDGIQYRSRWDNARLCWALYDRAEPALGPLSATQPLGDRNVIGPVLDQYSIALV
ncbi:MAG TPA: RES family NAD+ phosphorylase [Longimicrobium sp.]|jgi:hypothetical protein|uniref:RES family NAD+ phosphorylase n=1 Tax=Longimicrobium sp. TaxID=2029185 RepID=UPI002ED8079F